ncbi:MAG: PSD1 and planctomycete cytochrome C domain-containing protein [Planctomycetota bacterium]
MPLLTTALLTIAASPPQEAQPTADELAFFEAKIRPVLVERCYECHSTESGRIRGGLAVDSREGLLVGGDTGPAIVPGSTARSLLWEAITYEGYEMPPEGPLADDVVEDFRRWIEMGAPDPRAPEVELVRSEVTPEDIEAGRDFWSFRRPESAAPPAVKDERWARGDIDLFVLARLEENGMRPADDAPPEELLRRITFDLTGLPPTEAEQESFLKSWRRDADAAIAEVVEALLASPRFGERWGRHWLDVARYAESSGKELNATYPHAWRYRDYVIDSFNADKPYDRFLREQIAGDLLPAATDEEWAEGLVATGFLALGTKGLIEDDGRQFRADLVDEQIDVTTRAVLGISVACARCHDHKFEPIPQSDYYALAGIFGSTSTYFGTLDTLQNRQATSLLQLPVDDPNPFDRSYTRYEIEEMEAELQRANGTFRDALGSRREMRRGDGDGMTMSPDDSGDDRLNVARLSIETAILRGRLASVDSTGRPLSFCMGVQDDESPNDARLLVRGEVDQPGQEVPRGFVQVLEDPEHPTAIPADASGRLELADWLTSADNPLTARVFVNRVWLHLFGQGIVRSPEDFGSTGIAPTHPELLDQLALRFVDSGWSVKTLVRELMLSRVYRLDTKHDERDFRKDPENELCWRANPRRLDGEALRDAMLQASGELDLDRPRASTVARGGQLTLGRLALNALDLDAPATHRSVYLPIVRDYVPRSLDVFDFAEPTSVVGQRDATSTANQALYLMNSEFVIDQADAMARRLMDEARGRRARVERAFVLAYGRPAESGEIQRGLTFLREFEREGDPSERHALSALCQALFASAEFRFLD